MNCHQMRSASQIFLLLVVFAPFSSGFQPAPFGINVNKITRSQRLGESTELNALKIGKGYEPKWKKKRTLAEQDDGKKAAPKEVGLVGTIPVIFKQGNDTKTTMAIVGQPLSDVATQAGQFIKYGCGKGECGTCESLCDGKWIRPCTATVPADLAPGQELVISVKEVKSKSKSSGKFYSFRSFIMGFYNNLLGMVGFVKTRKRAKENWEERQEYEDLVAKKVAEKKAARRADFKAKKN